MLKFKTSCAVLAYLSSNLLNEVGLSLFRYFEVSLRVCNIVIKKLTFAISSPDEFLQAVVHEFIRLQNVKSNHDHNVTKWRMIVSTVQETKFT